MTLAQLLATIADDITVDTLAHRPPFPTVYSGWDELRELIHAWPEDDNVEASVALAREIAATAIRYILDTPRIAERMGEHADQSTFSD